MRRPRAVETGAGTLQVTFERRIVRGQRDVVAVGFDRQGQEVARQGMNTVAAKGYLSRDTDVDLPTWDEIEDIAMDLLRIQMDE